MGISSDVTILMAMRTGRENARDRPASPQYDARHEVARCSAAAPLVCTLERIRLAE